MCVCVSVRACAHSQEQCLSLCLYICVCVTNQKALQPFIKHNCRLKIAFSITCLFLCFFFFTLWKFRGENVWSLQHFCFSRGNAVGVALFFSSLQMWREHMKALILWCLCQNHSLPLAFLLPSYSSTALGCASLSETLAQHQWQSVPHHKSFWWSKTRRKHLALILLLTHCTHIEAQSAVLK